MIDLAHRLSRLSPARFRLLRQQLEQTAPVVEPIAIVGMGCRFPGAPDLASYWRLISESECAIREVPADRWDLQHFFDPAGGPGKTLARHGGFLEAIDQFDAPFFGIAPREAAKMDPQQRLLLEVTWQALEHAGQSPEQLTGSSTGVFIGIGAADYAKVPFHFDDYYGQIDAHSGTGNALSIAANRLSYFFDWHGPSLSVDTACSSALVALHTAANSLHRGEADMAVAGGVNLILAPEATIAFSNARMLSPDGHCRPFDSRANGYVRGEGAGVVVLKRLTDAIAHGDRVLATIRGTAVNQDGRTSGISAPNSRSQEAVIRAALKQAGLTPDEINYLEAHGTGTPLGDPIELEALRQVFRPGSHSEPCYVSSVKAQLGHLETASGIASVIKVVLMMEQGIIAPQADFAELNPHISLENERLRIPLESVPWRPTAQPRRAGVSSFGFGGTNAHVVLEQAQVPQSERDEPSPPVKLLALSAKSPTALHAVAAQYADFLEQNPEVDLDSLCYSANSGRSHFHHGLAIAAPNTAKLTRKLRELAAQDPDEPIGHRRGFQTPKVAFVFTGQGGQYAGMGKELFETQPFFRQTMQTCDDLLREPLQASILEIMHDQSQPDRVSQTRYTQPALFALEYSLALLWRSWGIEPIALLGHSVGEYVAATLAGVFTLEDGLRLIAERARLMQQCSAEGAMAAVFASGEVVEAILDQVRRDGEDRISVAAYNGPANTVVSGSREQVQQVVDECQKQGIKSTFLPVSHAFHSPLMDEMLDDFERFAATISAHPPRLPVVSNLTGEVLKGAPDAKYWREHLRRSVQFEKGMRALADLEPDFLLETGPSPTLLAMGRRFIDNPNLGWLASMREGQGDWQVLTGSLAELYHHGAKVRWANIYGAPAPAKLTLPRYPFERKRYWYQETGRRTARPGQSSNGNAHPLLGCQLPTVLPTRLFELQMHEQAPAYLAEHRVQGSTVTPAAAYLEQALAAADELFGPGSHLIGDVAIQQAMFLPEGTPRQVQLAVSEEQGELSTFRTYSRPADAESGDGWVLHACGKLTRAPKQPPANGHPGDKWALKEVISSDSSETAAEGSAAALEQRFPRAAPGEQFYSRMRQCGLEYGPRFRVLSELRRGDAEALARVAIPAEVLEESKTHRIHPAILDGCLQAMAGIVPQGPDGAAADRMYLPTGIGEFRLHGDPTQAAYIYVRRSEDGAAQQQTETVHGDILLLDAAGEVLAELHRVRVQSLGATPQRPRDAGELVYRMQWKAAEPSDLTAATDYTGTTWIAIADAVGIADQLADRIRGAGGRCVLVQPGAAFRRVQEDLFEIDPLDPEDYQRLFAAALSETERRCDGVLHLSSVGAVLDDADPDWERASQNVWGSGMRVVQQTVRAGLPTTPAIWFCTQGSQALAEGSDASPLQAALWGLGRTAALEYAGTSIRMVDLDPAEETPAAAASLLGELGQRDEENQVALRGGRRYVARLAAAELDDAAADRHAPLKLPAEPFRLRIREAGSFDALRYDHVQPPELQPDQVQLEVHSTGLNFSDVLKAMGLYPGLTDQEPPLGIECSGVVTAVGSEVTRFRVGDEVMGVAPYSFASHATTAEYALAHKPASLSHEEASTIPITFLTAHYALRWLGRIGAGERVLIHAGAGGVGQAALQIANHVGAEVFATAGSDEKREFLRQLGVSHVYNSRTLEFAEQILQETERRGVDIVLNSLPGDVIPKSLSILASYGRFLEIGKTDIYQDRMIGLAPFQDNLSYFAIDLDRMLRQRPDDIRRLFTEVMELFDQGVYSPLPFKAFPADETAAAFRYMAQRKNIGKVVVSFERKDRSAPESLSAPASQAAPSIVADASYVITGGLGSLGLRLARWLVDSGASHLVLMSRRAPSEAQQQQLDLLRQRARVHCLQADVSNFDSLQDGFAGVPADFPPIRGIIHAAGTLADGILYEMTLEQLERALQPKTKGAWNLHRVSQSWPLDFFMMFSSVASVLGSPGQANYAAGNAFLDGLAAYRRHRGLAATAVNWGPWADGGMATTDHRDSQLSGRGMRLLPPDDCLTIVDRLVHGADDVQLTVMDVDWASLAEQFRGGRPPLYEEFASQWETRSDGGAKSKVDRDFLRRVAETEPQRRQDLLQTYLAKELGRILGSDPDDLDPDQQLNVVGVDSLMAMELKTNLESQLDIELPMAALMEGPSIVSLAATILPSLESTMGGSKHAGEATAREAAVATSASKGSALVPLQSKGATPAVFCLHPIGGDLRCYRQLAKHLGESRRVMTIRPRGADEGTVPHECVEELAADYSRLIRGAQPEGPYLLVGWSTGGIFAYEIARQLRGDGAPVELVFIDTPTSAILDHVDLDDHARFLYDLVNFSNWFSGAKVRIEYADLKAMQRDQALDRILTETKSQGVFPEGTTRADLERRIDLCRAHLRAILEYQFQPLGQRVRMYRPKHSAVLSLASGRQLKDDLGWAPILGDDLEIERVGGDHFSMLTDRHAEQLAAAIAAHLDRVAPPNSHVLETA